MLVIVCYDVNTETRAGQRRLRRVAKSCESVGQRSVFECRVDLAGMEALEARLVGLMDLDTDCLRLYRLADSKGCEVHEHGRFKAVDFDAALVL